jgi:hypothetical protein
MFAILATVHQVGNKHWAIIERRQVREFDQVEGAAAAPGRRPGRADRRGLVEVDSIQGAADRLAGQVERVERIAGLVRDQVLVERIAWRRGPGGAAWVA